MAVSSVQTLDIASKLEEVLRGIEGLRVWRFVPDDFRPPGVVIAMPSIDWADPESGFCTATWIFPLSVIVSRNHDRTGQDALSRMVSEVAQALDAAILDGALAVEMLTGVPGSVNVSGIDLPSYSLRVRVRA